MDLTEPRKFETQTLRFSEALRQGIPHIKEQRKDYCGCAIGTAYRWRTGYAVGRGWHLDPIRACAEEFGMPLQVIQKISSLHEWEGWSREKCADYAESRGY